ncbi:MAG TPA: hypothetical protein DCL15_08730 [Chloroflexi bacterium]|nr:hypothetical protein [Chloroflexota bacterium]HHW88807.1 HD domain-containing protein [Chloroflexota bacterium]
MVGVARSPAARARPAGWWRKIRYRLSQFGTGLLAGVQEVDETPAVTLLSADALALFRRMPRDARRHSLRVLQTMEAAAPVPAELAVAALLHDVGKVAAREAGAYLGLWLRGPMVLAEAIAPKLLTQLATAQPSRSLRYAIYVQLHHPEIGAAWARAVGASDLTCWLIAEHQNKARRADTPEADTPEAVLLARLQAADDQS